MYFEPFSASALRAGGRRFESDYLQKFYSFYHYSLAVSSKGGSGSSQAGGRIGCSVKQVLAVSKPVTELGDGNRTTLWSDIIPRDGRPARGAGRPGMTSKKPLSLLSLRGGGYNIGSGGR